MIFAVFASHLLLTETQRLCGFSEVRYSYFVGVWTLNMHFLAQCCVVKPSNVIIGWVVQPAYVTKKKILFESRWNVCITVLSVRIFGANTIIHIKSKCDSVCQRVMTTRHCFNAWQIDASWLVKAKFFTAAKVAVMPKMCEKCLWPVD